MAQTLRILYLGDVMARPGREIVTARLPALRIAHKVDVVIAQSENVSHGKSMTPQHMSELQAAGVDFFTGGNHSIERKSIHGLLADPRQPVICPANMGSAPAEWGIKTLTTPKGLVLVMSILGYIAPQPFATANPLKTTDEMLERYNLTDFAALVINFHGDYSSEKKMMGHYVDGRASMLVGDHWHVQTADAEILPGGTAYQTDAGMCGTLHSSLGVAYKPLINRWRDGAKVAAQIEEHPPFQINGLLATIDTATRKAVAIRPIRDIYPSLEQRR